MGSGAAGDRSARRGRASLRGSGSPGTHSTSPGLRRNTTQDSAEPPECTFTAIDFETADYGADSACALALVHVRGVEIIGRDLFMIRPPRSRFAFTHIHGITWAHVRGEPSFAELWPEIAARLGPASVLAAHNAAFDRGVLSACCAAAGVPPPDLRFHCTVQLARRVWRLKRANLPAVCEHLGISLNHHDPASDAEACARIVIAARREGFSSGQPPQTRKAQKGRKDDVGVDLQE